MKIPLIGLLVCFKVWLAAVANCLLAQDVPLFNGKTLDGWTTLDGQPASSGWEVVDGMIRRNPRQRRAGHIITAREFGDFDLRFEWKIGSGGNSGLKYRVRRYDDGKWYGCEYQMLDDAGYPKNLSPRQSAGALYDLYEPVRDKRLLPAGEFNSSRIKVAGGTIQHWLNERLIISAAVGDEEWRARLATSKFVELDQFGENRRGRIMLTDHGSEVWFRNFKLELLPMDDQHR